jgi:hypothetical protein
MKYNRIKTTFYIIAVLIISIIALSFCNRKLNKTIDSFEKNNVSSKFTKDTTTTIDTVFVSKSDTIYFTVNKPIIVYKANDTILIPKEIIKYVNGSKIYVTDTLYANRENAAPVNLYVDSLINKDGQFYSYVVTTGKLYSHQIDYILNDSLFIITNNILNTIKPKPNLFQLYVGSELGFNSFNLPDINNLSITPKISVIFKEQHMISYGYDIVPSKNTEPLHKITYQYRLFKSK